MLEKIIKRTDYNETEALIERIHEYFGESSLSLMTEAGEMKDSNIAIVKNELKKICENTPRLRKYLQIYMFELCKENNESFPDTDAGYDKWIVSNGFLDGIKESEYKKDKFGEKSVFVTLLDRLFKNSNMKLYKSQIKDLDNEAYKVKRESLYLYAIALKMDIKVVAELMRYALRQKSVLPREYKDNIYRWSISKGDAYEDIQRLIEDYENDVLIDEMPEDKLQEYQKNAEISANDIHPSKWGHILKYIDTTSYIIGIQNSSEYDDIWGFRFFLKQLRDAQMNENKSIKSKRAYAELVKEFKTVIANDMGITDIKYVEAKFDEIMDIAKKRYEAENISVSLLDEVTIRSVFESESTGSNQLRITKDIIEKRIGRVTDNRTAGNRYDDIKDNNQKEKGAFVYRPSSNKLQIDIDELITQLREKFGENVVIDEEDIIIKSFLNVCDVKEAMSTYDERWNSKEGLKIHAQVSLTYQLKDKEYTIVMDGRNYANKDKGETDKILYVQIDDLTKIKRADIILMKFIIYSKGYDRQYFKMTEQGRSVSKIRPSWNGFKDEINAVLRTVYMPEMYIYNGFDLFIWLCFYCGKDDPFGYFMANWAKIR